MFEARPLFGTSEGYSQSRARHEIFALDATCPETMSRQTNTCCLRFLFAGRRTQKKRAPKDPFDLSNGAYLNL